MAGGLLNLIAYGSQNVILNGNPSKTFFKATWAKYTNFGLQKFRIDMTGQRTLNMCQESTFTFKIPRYGDLLMDTYLVINLPNIWSPILAPVPINSVEDSLGNSRDNVKQIQPPAVIASGPVDPEQEYSQWRPYEFKWIDNLGSQIIKEVRFSIGGQIIQKFSGDYLYNLVERDFRGDKKFLYYQMTGNTKELNNPANFDKNNGNYPNAWYTEAPEGAEPSIRAQTLYIPINIWFTLASQMAFPLVSLQYNQLEITFILRAVEDLFVVRDVTNVEKFWRIPNSMGDFGNYIYAGPPNTVVGNQWVNPLSTSQKAPYIRPRQTEQVFQFYRFLFQPNAPYLFDLDLSGGDFDTFPNKRTDWNADIHLISTFGFLDTDEVRVFALQPQNYLIREIFEWHQFNVVGTQRINLDSMGLVANWMFYLQRTDAIDRNEWSNYSNWSYDFRPQGLSDPPNFGEFFVSNSNSLALTPCCSTGPGTPAGDFANYARYFYYTYPVDLGNPVSSRAIGNYWIEYNGFGPGTHPGYRIGDSGIKITGNFTDKNQREILQSAAIILDGKYRENLLPAQIYSQVEKYVRTFGFAVDKGLHCYNFGLHTGGGGQSPFEIQPSGAINLSKFNTVQFEIQTYNPPLDASAQTLVICDPSTNEVIGINKPIWRIYEFTYNFKCMEERYNILRFTSGTAALAYAR